MAPALPSRRSSSAPKLCSTSSGVLKQKKGQAGNEGLGQGCGKESEMWRWPPCVSVCRSLASSMGRMELSRVEISAASRLHMAPNTLRSSSRRDTRCSCTVTGTREENKMLLHLQVQKQLLAKVTRLWVLMFYHLIIWNQRQHVLIVVGLAHPLAHLWICISLGRRPFRGQLPCQQYSVISD